MATSITTGQEIYSNRFLSGLTKAIAALRAFSTSFTDEAREVGEYVKVPLVSADTVSAWNATNNNFVRSAAATKQVSVDLSNRIIAGFAITSEQMAYFRPNWWEGKADLNVQEVANTILTAVAALVTADNFGDTADDKTSVTLGSFGRKAVAGIRAAGVKRKMIPARSALCLNPDFFSALLSDLDSQVYGGRDAIVGGVIPNLLGFTSIIEIPQLNGPGFLCHPDAIAVATRKVPLADEGPYKLVKDITEPTSGLTMTNVILAYGPDGSLNNSINAAYGCAVGNDGALMRLVG
jgi:hypothetical protein